MSNTTDVIISTAQTITVNAGTVAFLSEFDGVDGKTYMVSFTDGSSKVIDAQAFESIKALDYAGGGGGEGGIKSDTISNMEFDGDKTLTINSIPFEGGGGSSMVYDQATGILSGAKTVDGEDYSFEVGTVTIII